MRQTHVILRSTPVSTRDPFLGPLAGPVGAESLAGGDSVAAGVSVEVEEDIGTSRISALHANTEVIAIAPSSR